MSFQEKLRSGRFILTMEVDPPRGADPGATLNQVRRVSGLVDAVNVADSPMANLRMAPIAISYLIQRELGIETIFHLTCRDRNLLGLQAELLGAAALGVRQMLALTGDPPTRGNHPGAKAVFDLEVTGLVKIANLLNSGIDYMGNRLEGRAGFAVGVVCNPCADDLDLELAKLRSKLDAGAHFIQTQPVFDLERLERFIQAAGSLRVPVLWGLLPLTRAKSAVYLRDQAKMAVPDSVIQRLETGGAGEGRRIAIEFARALKEKGDGIHIFPYRDMDLAVEILECLK